MPRKSTTLLVVHTTATPYGKNYTVKQIDAMHRRRGFRSIGYHWIIDQNGKVFAGRPEKQAGAHVRGYNSRSIGVSYVGGYGRNGKATNTLNKKQEAALIKLLRDIQKRYPNAKICGHRDLSPDRDRDGYIEPHEWIKECPCFDAIPWAASHGLKVANIKGRWHEDATGPVVEEDEDEKRNEYLQRLLKMHGYEFGAIDGIVGPETRKAIKRFQAANDIKQSGSFDLRTVAKLREIENEKPLVKVIEKPVEKKVVVETKKMPLSGVVGLVLAIIAAVAGWAGYDYDDVTDAVTQEISENE